MSHVFIQGSDFKAKQWAIHIKPHCVLFSSASELLTGIHRLKGPKTIVFRYQNSQRSYLADLWYTLILLFVLLLRRPLALRIFWIMHNIDRETVDRYPLLTRIRRRILFRASEKVFVTDAYFKALLFSTNDKVKSISFGRKQGGTVSEKTMAEIIALREISDIVILCVGSAGNKYVHFDRLSLLQEEAARCDKKLSFILPEFVRYTKGDVINIVEKNLNESQLRGLVDFIYRINDDISMPFTIYSACSAGIPLISSSEFFTSKIIAEYGLGFTEEEFASVSESQLDAVQQNMNRFLATRSWSSLGEQIL